MVMGALHPGPDPCLAQGTGTVVLLGPREPGFWAHFTAQPEYRDGAPDPLDRWSKRVIGELAESLDGAAVFPSDGPPWPPFIAWAQQSGRTWASPVGLLVHDEAGLMVSYRGAIALGPRYDLPAPAARPCDTCPEQPCRTACPVGALGPEGYDIDACRAHIAGEDRAECRKRGCAARRACPVSARYGRLEAQSAFHMDAFL